MTKTAWFLRRYFNQFWRRSPLFLISLALSIGLGLQLARAVEPTHGGTVDPLQPQHQLAQQLYLQNCGTCHLAVPPAVLPTQTWYRLINDTRHYSVEIQPLPRFDAQLISRYLQFYSRPYYEGEQAPFQIADSRFFSALHPQVELQQPPTLRSCVACHPQAADFNFRQISDPAERSSRAKTWLSGV